jgi:threonine synthase
MMKSNHFYEILDRASRESVPEKKLFDPHFIPSADLDVVYDYKRAKRRVMRGMKNFSISLDALLSLLPVDMRDAEELIERISLHEGRTPLYKSIQSIDTVGTRELYYKYEGTNPTGSFKDRGSLIEVVKAVQHNAKAIILASTGNMAASVSAYAARAHMPCYVVVPDSTPAPKLSQALFYGANLIKVDGMYDDAVSLSIEIAAEYDFYLAGDYLYRQEGQKNQAYEIILQLGNKVPDWIIIPVGNGTNISAVYRGFAEFKKMGLTDRMPKFLAVQSDKYDAIYKRYHNEDSQSENGPTVSTAIAVKNPSDLAKVIDLVKETNGHIIKVSDNQAILNRRELALTEGIFVEPSSATVLSGLKWLKESGEINPKHKVVLLLTGSGLKDPTSGLDMIQENAINASSLEEFRKALNLK